MIKSVRRVEKKNIFQETFDTEDNGIIEENLSVEDLNIENQSLVRMEMNMIEYPLFSKNPRRKVGQRIKYFFNNKKDVYIVVSPTSGDYVPGEFEERVFIALTKIMKNKGYQQTFYVSVSEIYNQLNCNNPVFFDRIKKAIIRLSQSSYEFRNTLYSNKSNGVIEDSIHTNILNVRIVSLKDRVELRETQFDDKRIKEVYEITISKHFYDNIIRKGYLVYDSATLLSIDSSITRTIYMLINKRRFTDLYLKIPIVYLIKRIPLKFEAKNVQRTVKTIENSCTTLVEMGLISKYEIIKNGKWVDAEVEFFFDEIHNKIKQIHFYEEKDNFERNLEQLDLSLLISHTEEENLGLLEIKKEREAKIVTDDMVESIFKRLPNKARELKTMFKAIKESITLHGIEKVGYVADYVKSQKVGNIRSYFLQALEKGWADDFMEKAKRKRNEASVMTEQKIHKKLYSNEDIEEIKRIIEMLPLTTYTTLENSVYREYIEKCGMEGMIQKKAFERGKEGMIVEYIIKNKLLEGLRLQVEDMGIPQVTEIEEIQMTTPIEKKVIVEIEEKFESFSSYKFKVFELMDGKIEMAEVKKILDFLSLEKEFFGTIGNYKFSLTFKENNLSKIMIMMK
jgi:hypothetical protein